MHHLCVYCGSKTGASQAYAKAAIALGTRLTREGIRLIYGGGNVGLMGILANAVLDAGGEVTGVIPKQLVEWEMAHQGVTELIVVDSMHQRKQRMFELADGFIALPGGFGTLDEMFEMLTWRQIGLGQKPCAFFDVNDFWQPMLRMLKHMVDERFLHPAQRHDFWHGDNLDAMLAWMRGYTPASATTWMDEKRRAAMPGNVTARC